jgi:hypothetical protein
MPLNVALLTMTVFPPLALSGFASRQVLNSAIFSSGSGPDNKMGYILDYLEKMVSFIANCCQKYDREPLGARICDGDIGWNRVYLFRGCSEAGHDPGTEHREGSIFQAFS